MLEEQISELYGYDDAYSFGRKLREIRRKKKITQDEMAEYLGIGRNKMINIERGEIYDVGVVFKMLKRLGLRIKLYEVELKVEEV